MKTFKLREGISKKGYWIFILAFFNILLMVSGGIILREFPQKHAGGPRQIVLRYDDYRLYKDNEEGTVREAEFINFALTNRVKMSIAAIPFAISDEEMQKDEVLPFKIQLLAEGLRKNLFEICLHGYQHKNNSIRWSPSEFSGVPLLTQERWIEKGKRKLESLTGAKVKVFVPPFNGWDQNTLTALTGLGFSILSAEAGTFPRINHINYFPYTVTPKELQYLLANNYLGNDKLIIVNIHPFDLVEDKNRIGFSKLKKLLEEFKDPDSKMELESFGDMVAKGVVFTQRELLNLSKRFDEVRFWDNLPLSGYLIRTTCLAANRPYYSSLVLNFLKIVMGVNLFIIGFLIAKIIGEKIRTRMLICALVGFLGIVMFIILLRSFDYLSYGQIIAGKRYSMMFLTFGALVGFLFRILAASKVEYLQTLKKRFYFKKLPFR